MLFPATIRGPDNQDLLAKHSGNNKQVGLLLQLKNVLIIGGGKEKRKY